jgi:hypothetical protein
LALPYYKQQVKFVERRLLDTIDKIRARSKKPPVIVIESDEGFESGETTFGEAAMRQIRVKGLVALSIPGMRGAPGPNPPNTVNVLRYVFNKVSGTHYPMLRSASYPEGDYPYQWEEMRVR